MINCDVAIVGGGAAGLACAVTLKRKNKNINVVVIDACERLGKKLAATGNGQGNVTNSRMSATYYHGSGARLAADVCCGDYRQPLSLFNCLFEEDGEGRVYPTGRQASALTDGLLHEIKNSGVCVISAERVTDIKKGFTLSLVGGQRLFARFVVLACGGKAQKQFKTDGSAYFLAQSLGHKLTPLYPSLVQLKTDVRHIKTLKGIRVNCTVTALCGGEKIAQTSGDVIFTDYGVSGNAIFKISPYVVDRQGVTLSLEFLPEIPAASIEADVAAKQAAGYPRSELLCGTLHNQIGRAVIRRSDESSLPIVDTLKSFTLPVIGTLGFDYAQVTRGGIDASDIGADLQSKLCPGLYFAGEYIDVDGDCGGYNLNWAFSSGIFVAKNIAEKFDD